jgi:putative membrane protein
MFTDWALASLHHLAIFTLAAVLAAELAILTPAIDARSIGRLARIDMAYGASATIVVIVGVCRVIWGAKGYEYYVANHIFWTKMALFLVVGLLSIAPTIRYLTWRNALRADPAFRPATAEVKRMRAYLWTEAAFFLAIPVAAAAMARGYGMAS